MAILALIGIDKHQVEVALDSGQHITGIADVQIDARRQRRGVEVGANEILKLIVDFYGIEAARVVGKPLGKAESRISGESAEFENVLRTYHAHHHLEHASLQMPRTHARTQVIEVRLAVEAAQVVALGIDVLQYVVFKFFLHKKCPQKNPLFSKQGFDGKAVAVEPEPENHTFAGSRKHRVRAELLAAVHI